MDEGPVGEGIPVSLKPELVNSHSTTIPKKVFGKILFTAETLVTIGNRSQISNLPLENMNVHFSD